MLSSEYGHPPHLRSRGPGRLPLLGTGRRGSWRTGHGGGRGGGPSGRREQQQPMPPFRAWLGTKSLRWSDTVRDKDVNFEVCSLFGCTYAKQAVECAGYSNRCTDLHDPE